MLISKGDRLVPKWSSKQYFDALKRQGLSEPDTTRLLESDDGLGHAWNPRAPDEIVAWCQKHGTTEASYSDVGRMSMQAP